MSLKEKYRIFHAMEPPVFLGSAFFVIAFVIFGGLFTETAASLFKNVQDFIVSHFGWFYILTTTVMLVFVVWLMFSRFGSIRLGGDQAEPEFIRPSWFAMLFSAGMGTGLVFWGVAEPMKHYLSPPRAEPRTTEALVDAMHFSFFHWGLHPWAVYGVFGLCIAYFHFRHKLPLAPRSILYPLFGERVWGPLGHAVDILCTVGTLFGVATSLGLGAMQVNTGLQPAGVPSSVGIQVGVIAAITVVATISVVTGIHAGIRRLSQFNLGLAGLMLLFVFLTGPTLYLIRVFVTSTGEYLQHLVGTSLWMKLDGDRSWQKDWTLFYWAWWISWSPFVGIFTARISYGRTIREYLGTVLVVPTVVTFLWLSVFGGTGLYLEGSGAAAVADAVQQDVANSLHALLQGLPFSTVTMGLATLLVIVFFVTSSDSGSLVDDMVTSGGHPDPPSSQRVFWAVSEGAVAAVLLLTGGLNALQTASLTSGLPMALLLFAMGMGLVKALRVDVQAKGTPKRERLVNPSR